MRATGTRAADTAMDLLDAFSLPFMQRAALAGLVLGAVLPLLGVFVTLKRISFFGDGIAHASLAGVAVGVVAGLHPFALAVSTAVLFGIGVYLLERKTLLAPDAVIGVLFPTGLAFGVLLLSMEPGYRPELMSFLFGNILALQGADVLTILLLGGGVLAFLLLLRRALALLVLDREEAWLSGLAVERLELALYIVLSVAIVLGVKLLGVILVSALLVIPPSTSALFAASFRQMSAGAVAFGIAAVVIGLLVSFALDLPSGASIILASSGLFFAGLAASRLAS